MSWLIYAAEAIVVFDVVLLGLVLMLRLVVARRMADLADVADWRLWSAEVESWMAGTR